MDCECNQLTSSIAFAVQHTLTYGHVKTKALLLARSRYLPQSGCRWTAVLFLRVRLIDTTRDRTPIPVVLADLYYPDQEKDNEKLESGWAHAVITLVPMYTLLLYQHPLRWICTII